MTVSKAQLKQIVEKDLRELENYGKNDAQVTAKVRYDPSIMGYLLIVDLPDGTEGFVCLYDTPSKAIDEGFESVRAIKKG